jgi:hypothetical protein
MHGIMQCRAQISAGGVNDARISGAFVDIGRRAPRRTFLCKPDT